jgi:hypothetical protein
MIAKLQLPFPMLSDPDRSAAIEPYELANPHDKRNLAYPAIIAITPDGEEAFRVVSRDFADRLPEDELIAHLVDLQLTPTAQDPPDLGPAEPGLRAMPIHAMEPYFRGARFAAVAMGMRHESAKEDADHYVAQMDRFIEATRGLKARIRAAGDDGA